MNLAPDILSFFLSYQPPIFVTVQYPLFLLAFDLVSVPVIYPKGFTIIVNTIHTSSL